MTTTKNKRKDNRTEEQQQTHKCAWVGEDTILSGWGMAEGRLSIAGWAFPEGKENNVERWVRSRGDMKRVRLVTLDGYDPEGGMLHIYVVKENHPAWNF